MCVMTSKLFGCLWVVVGCDAFDVVRFSMCSRVASTRLLPLPYPSSVHRLGPSTGQTWSIDLDVSSMI